MSLADRLRRRREPGPVEHTDPATPPHCDALVLHAPGACRFCDERPEWQAYRLAAGIAFSGHDPRPGQVPCPSEQRRPREVVQRWPGNRAKPAGEEPDFFGVPISELERALRETFQ